MKLDIKPYKQSTHFCAPACVKMVLNYYGERISEKRLADLINASRENGCPARPIVSAVRKLGFNAYSFDNNYLKDLEHLLKMGIPPIVNWCMDPEEDHVEIEDGDGGHYSVLSRITKRDITLIDPLIGGPREMGRREFYKKWYDFYGKRLRSDEANKISKRMIAIYP